jgi:uncharacterized protein
MIEIRALAGPGDIDATDEGIIFGLAIPYHRETVIGDLKENGFREQIAPGAATKSIREADIVALHNHDSSKPLGRTSAGNLTLKNTTRGVEPELKPSDTSYARDLATLVKDKVIRGWSFGFEVVRDDWTDDEGNPSDQWSGTNRIIREMKVAEVSPCTFPAYDMTSISNRDAVSAAREGRGEKREAAPEDKTREPGAEKGEKPPESAEKTARRALKAAKAALRRAKAARDTGEPMTEGTASRIPQIRVCIEQAIACLRDDKPDIDSCLALLGSAVEHAGHIEHHEKIDNDGSGMDDDADDAKRADPDPSAEKRTKPKPEKSTSAELLTDDALRASFADACRREIDLSL